MMKKYSTLLILFIFYSLFSIAQTDPTPLSPEDEALLAKIRAQAAASGTQMTPEQETKLLNMQRAFRSIRLGANQVAPLISTQTPAAPQTAASQTEEQLAAKVAELPPRPEKIVLDHRKDGWTINGQGYVDPEGAIRNFAIDPVSGLVTYLAETGKGQFNIKIARVGTDAEPIIIGTASSNNGGWAVQTLTGKKLNGQALIVLSGGGFLVSRQTATFVYRPGKGIRNIAIPAGFTAARFQRGDVLNTESMLIERDDSDQDSGSKIFSSIKGLGSTLGLTTKEDYALYSFSTSQATPINISDAGKNVSVGANCKKRNIAINECATMYSYESLYDKMGLKNLTHYYWRINWFNAPAKGPILVALENGVRDINITDVKSGKKVLAFNRTLGIHSYDTVQNPDGRIALFAKIALSTEKIDDVVAFLDAGADIKAAVTAPEVTPPTSQQ